MLVFKKECQIHRPFNVVFLCGSKYSRINERDKRNILQEYIKQNITNGHAMILEQNFQFRSTTKSYLSYDEIFLKGLAEIEQLTSLYADKVLIVHETNSTAAELGMLAANRTLAPKICVLTPDGLSVEGDKVGGFIELAFINKNAMENKVHLVRYYPDTELHRFSVNKMDYFTFFHEDRIGPNLSLELKSFLESAPKSFRFSFRKVRFENACNSEETVDYKIVTDSRKVLVSLSASALKYQLMALLSVDDIKKILRKEKEIREHVSYLEDKYRSILKETISRIDGQLLEEFKIECTIKHSTCSLRQAVGYFLYFLQAARLIELKQSGKKSPSIRKVSFSKNLDSGSAMLHELFEYTDTTEFGRLGI